MASKMKRTKKLRSKKTSPNTAGNKRRETQEAAAKHNSGLSRSPWQKQRDKRYHSPDRVAKRNNYRLKKAKEANA